MGQQMLLRYYDPAGGRFVSRDPLGLWGDAAQAGNAQGYCGHNPVNRVDPLGLMDEALEKALRKVAESERASEMLADALQEMENLAQKAADNVTQSEAAARRLRDTGQASAADDAARQAKKLRESLEKEITGIVDDVISKTTDPDVVKALKELQRRGGAGSVADILKRLSKWSEGAKVLRRAARGLKLTKGIPLFGALVALLFFPFEVQAKGTGPAAANAIADGFPVLGGTKVVVELVQGEDAIPDKEDRQKPNTPCPDRLLGGLIPDVGGIPLGSDVAPVSGGGR